MRISTKSFGVGLNQYMTYDQYRAVQRLMKSLDLIEVTTDRQARNGTIMYEDPQTCTDDNQIMYGIYKTGYVRRLAKRKTKSWYAGIGYITMSPMNRRIEKTGISSYRNQEFTYYSIHSTPGHYAELAAHAVPNILNYRK